MTVSAVLMPQMFGSASREFRLEGGTIAEMLGEARDIPGLLVYLNGHAIEQRYWHVITPKDGTHIDALVPVHGGGGGKKGGGKNSLAIIASLVVVAAAIVVSGGGAAGLLGPAFAAETVGAAALGAAISIAGTLAIAALFPAGTLSDPSQDEGEAFKSGSIEGNRLDPGAAIPRVVGTHLVTPPLGAPPVTRIINGEEELEAFFVLAGPHALGEIQVNGVDITDAEGITFETREGWDSDIELSLVKTQNFVHNVGQELSRFKLENVLGTDNLLNQSEPSESEPRWHRFTTRMKPDQVDLRIQIISIVDSDAPGATMAIPFRLRIREKGDTTWINLPEFWFEGRNQSLMSREFRLVWGAPPEKLGTTPTENGFTEWARTIPDPTDTTTTNVGWTGDAYFTSTKAQADGDGVSVYLDTATFPKGVWEIEVKRGMTLKRDNYTFSTYLHIGDAKVRSFFEAHYDGSMWETIENQKGRSDKVIISSVISRWNEHPMPRPGMAAVAIRGRAINVQSLSVIASGYVQDWSGAAWDTWVTTSNPAPHYRDVLIGMQNANPLSASQIDSDTLVSWRTECASQGYRCDLVTTDDSVISTALKIASCGFAVPRQADTWAVAYERDRSADSPRQIWHARNSRNYTFAKSYSLQPGIIKSSILDRDDDYRQTEILTENTGPGQKALPVETINYPGLTSIGQITKRVCYDMAQITHRGVIHTIEIPVEYLQSRKGDLVGFETDVLNRHIDAREVTAVSVADITLNDTITYLDDAGLFSESDIFADQDWFAIGETSYCAIVNKASTSIRKITAWNSGTKVATLASAPTNVAVGDRFIIGLGANVYRRMLILSIQPLQNLEARIEMVDEAPLVVACL